MLGQEEALKSALHQLEEDVEGKLDRMELQPLKDYFGKFYLMYVRIIYVEDTPSPHNQLLATMNGVWTQTIRSINLTTFFNISVFLFK